MKKQVNIKVVLDSSRRKDGQRRVLLRYGRNDRYPTGLYATEMVDGIIVRDRFARAKNEQIAAKVDEIEEYLIRGLDFRTACERAYTRNKERLLSDVFAEFMSTKKGGTLGIYQETVRLIEEFDKDVLLKKVDRLWLIRFDLWMSGEGSRHTMGTNARSIRMRCLRAVINFAIDQEYTQSYPFRRFSIKQEPTRKRSMTVEQVRALRDYPCSKVQEKYRDIWMLCFYLCGINMVDLWKLTPANISGGYLDYVRQKTHKPYHIKVEPEAEEILAKYKGKRLLLSLAEDYPNYQTFQHEMAVELKKFGNRHKEGRKFVYESLFPEISCYWARHSWATIASSIGIGIEDIGLALGHSNDSVTAIYIRYSQDRIDRSNRKVLDKVKGDD